MEYTNSNPSPEKEYILSVLARNRAGVLLRIAGLFSRRCYNILSIVAAQTEDTEYSRILIVVSGDDRIVLLLLRGIGDRHEAYGAAGARRRTVAAADAS